MDKILHIGKVFVNTGATFHTLLLKNSPAKFFEEYDYKAVTVDSEHIFRQVTQMTYGQIMQTNNMEKFVKKVYPDKEDPTWIIEFPLIRKPGMLQARMKLSRSMDSDRLNFHVPMFVTLLADKMEEVLEKFKIMNLKGIEIGQMFQKMIFISSEFYLLLCYH